MTRFFVKCGQRTADVLLHAMADMAAKESAAALPENGFASFVNTLFKQYLEFIRSDRIKAPLLTGKDLINDLKLSPGPLFRQILKAVRINQLSGNLVNRRQALNWVEAWLSAKGLATGPGKSTND